jgi:hypothetical protein
MQEICRAFNEQDLVPPDPNVRMVGWITLDDPEETAFWNSSQHEAVRLFLQLNPGYQKGRGLVTFILS